MSPQALEKLQFLYLADNLLDSIPGPLPLSLRSLHLQVRSLDQTKGQREGAGWKTDARGIQGSEDECGLYECWSPLLVKHSLPVHVSVFHLLCALNSPSSSHPLWDPSFSSHLF